MLVAVRYIKTMFVRGANEEEMIENKNKETYFTLVFKRPKVVALLLAVFAEEVAL